MEFLGIVKRSEQFGSTYSLASFRGHILNTRTRCKCSCLCGSIVRVTHPFLTNIVKSQHQTLEAAFTAAKSPSKLSHYPLITGNLWSMASHVDTVFSLPALFQTLLVKDKVCRHNKNNNGTAVGKFNLCWSLPAPSLALLLIVKRNTRDSSWAEAVA